jgi:hypothetical protein
MGHPWEAADTNVLAAPCAPRREHLHGADTSRTSAMKYGDRGAGQHDAPNPEPWPNAAVVSAHVAAASRLRAEAPSFVPVGAARRPREGHSSFSSSSFSSSSFSSSSFSSSSFSFSSFGAATPAA